jgi:hypothetical protein
MAEKKLYNKAYFTAALIKLNIIEPCRRGVRKIKFNENFRELINDETIRTVTFKMRAIKNEERNGKPKEKEKTIQNEFNPSFFDDVDARNVEQITSNGLEIYATEELIKELKSRGFTGELKQVHTGELKQVHVLSL